MSEELKKQIEAEFNQVKAELERTEVVANQLRNKLQQLVGKHQLLEELDKSKESVLLKPEIKK